MSLNYLFFIQVFSSLWCFLFGFPPFFKYLLIKVTFFKVMLLSDLI